MSIDVHAVCAPRLNDFNTARMAREARQGAYDDAYAEFQGDMQDVMETCGALEFVDEHAGDLFEELWNNPVDNTLATPRFWNDLIGVVSGAGVFGLGCMIEIAGAMQSERAFRIREREMDGLRAAEEQARAAYVKCLHEAGFQASRRSGALRPPVG